MNKLFYPKLAISNIKKNRKVYFPYLFACIFTIGMFFIMLAIASSKEVMQLPNGEILVTMLYYGVFIIGIFSVVILFYTNSFLMRQRKKELGLYNILGMEKKHIAQMLFFEMLFIATVSIGLGLLFGMLFSKLMYLVLMKLVAIPSSLDFSFSLLSFIITILLFFVIFTVILLFNMMKVRLTNPIDLLKGGQYGAKEPRTKWILTIAGFLFLGIAYYLALSIESPIKALNMFFIAAVLVIIGTYCLFIAGSIAILKLLRKNKKIYYQSSYFISISGMLYRMKQHAAGLASICILSTMVLVTLTTTASLYAGQEDILNQQFPREYAISYNSATAEDIEMLHRIVNEEAYNFGLETENMIGYQSVAFTVTNNDGEFEYAENLLDLANTYGMVLIDIEDYNSLRGTNDSLAENEVLLYSDNKYLSDTIEIAGQSFEIAGKLNEFPELPKDTFVMDIMVLVVEDMDVAKELFYRTTGGELSGPVYYLGFDLNLDSDEAIEFTNALNDRLADLNARLQTRQETRDGLQFIFGGFLFLGIFLGTLFLMATGLIIYYKQISEGYEDKERFNIMQKVGMSKEEVKKSIRSQTLMVFFFPLIMAVIHLTFAFKMITKLLALFNLTNVTLFFFCTIITVFVFAVIYVILYRLTAKAYYKIVS